MKFIIETLIVVIVAVILSASLDFAGHGMAILDVYLRGKALRFWANTRVIFQSLASLRWIGILSQLPSAPLS